MVRIKMNFLIPGFPDLEIKTIIKNSQGYVINSIVYNSWYKLNLLINIATIVSFYFIFDVPESPLQSIAIQYLM